MIKPYFKPMTRKPVVASAPPTSLTSLYRQQRVVTAAQQVATHPTIKQALGYKQEMLGRRIGRLQAQAKTQK